MLRSSSLSPPPPTPPVSPEAFFTWDNGRPDRHEFIDGDIRAIDDAILHHSEITSNLQTALHSRLRPTASTVIRNLKLRIGPNYCYPDVMVHRRPQDRAGWLAQFVEHPQLLAEVHSPESIAHDLSKWPLYQRIPSLHTFLLIAQDKIKIHLYRRSGAEWRYTLHTDLGDVLDIRVPRSRSPCTSSTRASTASTPRSLRHPDQRRPICPPCAVHFQCPTNTYSRLQVATKLPFGVVLNW